MFFSDYVFEVDVNSVNRPLEGSQIFTFEATINRIMQYYGNTLHHFASTAQYNIFKSYYR